jgi:regulator of protease activity HflC (stomatin/prohibitin superfamily)
MLELLMGVGGMGALVLGFLVLTGFRVAQEYERAVVFRLGRFTQIKGPGLYWLVPLIEWQRKLDLRTVTVDVERQEAITKDSVTIKVNAVVWYRIDDPVNAVISVERYHTAVYQVAMTSMRNIIGQHLLDEVLKERDQINETLWKIIDQATDPWGIKVEMVEMKDVEIPEAMQRAMAREAEAVREKRARIIKSEAELEASEKLSEASRVITENPAALELRRMQMLSEIGAEHNTTTIIMMPSDFVTMAREATNLFSAGGLKAEPRRQEVGDGKNGTTQAQLGAGPDLPTELPQVLRENEEMRK